MNLQDVTSEPKENDTRVSGQGRFDIRTLARIATFLDQRGVRAKSRSHLLYSAIELLDRVLAEAGVVLPAYDYSQAFHELKRMGIEWPSGSKGHEQLLHGLKLSALNLDGADVDKESLKNSAAALMDELDEDGDESS